MPRVNHALWQTVGKYRQASTVGHMHAGTYRHRTLALARRFSKGALDRYAAICRVQLVMRPCLETLVS